MSILNMLANAFRKRGAVRNNVSDEAYIPADKDSIHIFSSVSARCDDQTDADKVMAALWQLTSLWSGDQKKIPLCMAIIPETYPHLEKMVDAKYLSPEWLAALSGALTAAGDNIHKVAEEQERMSELFDEVERKKREREESNSNKTS